MRRKIPKESVRGFPYYKIQYWDEFSICWVSIPKTFDAPQKAESFALTIGKKYGKGEKYRIMEITLKGQKPFKTSE